MKVSICDRQLWLNYLSIISLISSILSLVLLFVDISKNVKNSCFIGMIAILVILFFVLWGRANHMQRVTLKINDSEVVIEKGDIFYGEGYRVIPFNEYFDTQVDNGLISSKTINGQFLQKNSTAIRYIENQIDNDSAANSNIVREISNRVPGKKKQYKLGTIVKYENYFILAFSKFDDRNRAYLKMDEYISCLLHMWDECDRQYNGESITMPLLGSGITRFRCHKNITDQELLEMILWTFELSSIRFRYQSKLRIVLTDDSLKNINLYEIKRIFKSKGE